MADALTALQNQILRDLDVASGELDLRRYCDSHNVDYKAADGACRSLAAATYTTVLDQSTTTLELAAESLAYIEHGSPEYQFLALVTAHGPISQADAIKEAPIAIGKLGLAWCMKHKWIKNDANGNLVRAVEGDVVDVLVNQLRAVREGGELDSAAAKDLKRRKLVKQIKVATVLVRKGPGFSISFKKQVADLTKEMLEGYVLFARESSLLDRWTCSVFSTNTATPPHDCYNFSISTLTPSCLGFGLAVLRVTQRRVEDRQLQARQHQDLRCGPQRRVRWR